MNNTNLPGTETEKMRITSAGNVGIGTTTPTAKLDVSGDTRITGDLTVQGKVITDTLVNRTVQNLTVSGSLYPYATSSAKDIGATGNRWADLWLSGNATIAGTVTAPTFVGNLTGNATTATTATSVPWTGITGKPTTVAGYGITDFVSSNSASSVTADPTTTNGHYLSLIHISEPTRPY